MDIEFISLMEVLMRLDLKEPDESRDDEKRRRKVIGKLFEVGFKFTNGLEENSVVMTDDKGNPIQIIRREGGLKFEGGSF